MKPCAIIIPVYKSSPDNYEKSSYIQCLNILKSYDIIIVTYKECDIHYYIDTANELNKEIIISYFDASFFRNIEGYNKLMLDYNFYKRFKNYTYILIYQLDAFVFKDELEQWCAKSYDYIGAPWFERFSSHEEGAKLWLVGNGGFSLRRVKYFTKVLSWKFPVRKVNLLQVFRHFRIGLFLSAFGWKNNINYLIKENRINEDVFYCISLKDSLLKPNVPPPDIARYFSLEKSPTYLFELNSKQIPFGCHAFRKYEFESFWKKYIPEK